MPNYPRTVCEQCAQRFADPVAVAQLYTRAGMRLSCTLPEHCGIGSLLQGHPLDPMKSVPSFFHVKASVGMEGPAVRGVGIRGNERGPYDFNALVFLLRGRKAEQAVVGSATDDPASRFISTRPVDHDLTSPNSYIQANLWIKDCLENHSACSRRTEAFEMPSRLIDVGDNLSNSLHIYSTKNSFVAYVALSYCWGSQAQTHLLTQSNLSKWTSIGLSQEDLPQTIQDAITVTRGLGLKYLWVDSLCIVQNSRTDIEHEIGKMQAVYENAYVTVVAADAASGEGFLNPVVDENDKAASPFSVSLRLPDGELGSIVVERYVEYAPHLHAINKRGWTLQERLLSPRCLIYTNNPNRLIWDCQTLLDSHGGFQPSRRGGRSHAHCIGRLHPAVIQGGTATLPNTERTRSHPFSRNIYDDIRLEWRGLMENYVKRDFSKDLDRLHGIASLGAKFKAALPPDHIYAAGMWIDPSNDYGDFLHSLLWCANSMSLVKGEDQTKSFRRQPREYIAPSWSWASKYFNVMWEEPASNPRCKVLRYCPKLQSEALPFGQLLKGTFVELQGSMEPTTIHPFEVDYILYEMGYTLEDLKDTWYLQLSDTGGLLLERNILDDNNETFQRIGIRTKTRMQIYNELVQNVDINTLPRKAIIV